MNMKANFQKLNTLFATFDQRVRPITKRIRSMLLAKKFGLKPEPTQEQIDRDMQEFNERILPMLNHQLEDKLYFCGPVITGYDLQVFCEINSIKIFAQELVTTQLQECANLVSWVNRIEIVPEVQEVEQRFTI